MPNYMIEMSETSRCWIIVQAADMETAKEFAQRQDPTRFHRASPLRSMTVTTANASPPDLVAPSAKGEAGQEMESPGPEVKSAHRLLQESNARLSEQLATQAEVGR
jgi:hypothetical protein